MTQKGKERKKQYREEVLAQYTGKITSEPLKSTMTLYFGDHRVRDHDNFGKLIWDSMEGVIYENDSQIQIGTVIKEYDKENPRTEIIIEKLTIN